MGRPANILKALNMGFDAVLVVRLVLVGLAVLLGLLAALTWAQRREAPGAAWFALLVASGAIYAFGYSGEVAQTTLAGAMRWIDFESLALPWIPGLWLVVALRHNGAKINALGLFVIPVVTFAGHFTNRWHHLFYGSVRMVQEGPFRVVSIERGPLAMLDNAYLLLALAVGSWLYLARYRNGSRQSRNQSLVMIASCCMPVGCYFIYLAGMSPLGLDLGPFGLGVSAVLFYHGIFRLQAFDLAPTARDLVFKAMRDAVVIVDPEYKLLDFNPAAAALLPVLSRKKLGDEVATLLAAHPGLAAALTGGASGEVVVETMDGPDAGMDRFFDVRTFPLLGGAGVLGQAAILADVTAQVELREELRLHAETDSLTGLANRRRFLEALEMACERAQQSAEPFSVLLLDVDRFKRINDRHGHPVGDAVLRAVSGRLQGCLKGTELLARYGGEEFAVLLPGARLEAALDCAELLRVAVGTNPIAVEGLMLPLTISVGMVTNEGPAWANASELLQGSDLALYRAKTEGRDRVVIARAVTEEERHREKRRRPG